MFEIIPLEFKEKENGDFEAETIFGIFRIWKAVRNTKDENSKEYWNFRSLDKKTKRFYVDKKDSYKSAESNCQKDYVNIFKGLIREKKDES